MGSKVRHSFKSPEKQAKDFANFLFASQQIPSLGTRRTLQVALTGLAWFAKLNKLGDLKSLTKEHALAFLGERLKVVRQSPLNLDRIACQYVIGEKLTGIISSKETKLGSRAYTPRQVEIIAAAQAPKHALATRVAYQAGLRAKELATIRPIADQAEDKRDWSKNRFLGREGVPYSVRGKGGFIHKIMLPKELSAKLEAVRLPAPVTSYDRGIKCVSLYAIGHGKNWSNSFSKATKDTGVVRHGAHGLRHTYAQERMLELRRKPHLLSYDDCLLAVSHELAHLRPEITLTYLRP